MWGLLKSNIENPVDVTMYDNAFAAFDTIRFVAIFISLYDHYIYKPMHTYI